MKLAELKIKYPFINECIDIFEGVEVLNQKKMQRFLTESLQTDLHNFEGTIIIDDTQLKLDKDDKLIHG